MGNYNSKPLHTAVAATGNGAAFSLLNNEQGAYATVVFQVTGTFTATITFEGTTGRSATQTSNTWVAIKAENVTTGAVATTATSAGVYRANVGGLTQVRARVTWSSGTSVTVFVNAITEWASDPHLSTETLGVVSPGSAVTGPGNPVVDSYTHAAFNLAAANDQVLVASAASKQIWVYGIGFTVNVAGTVSFQDEDNTAITGIMPFGNTSGMVVGPSGNFAMPIWKLATDKDLEVDVVTSELDGWIDYAIVSV